VFLLHSDAPASTLTTFQHFNHPETAHAILITTNLIIFLSKFPDKTAGIRTFKYTPLMLTLISSLSRLHPNHPRMGLLEDGLNFLWYASSPSYRLFDGEGPNLSVLFDIITITKPLRSGIG